MATLEEQLTRITEVGGFLGVGIVAEATGRALHCKTGTSSLDLEQAALGIARAVRSKHETITQLDAEEHIEDVLITMGTQYHLIRPLLAKEGHFVYLVLDKAVGNLAMARFLMANVDKATDL